ncbi:MAG: tRNA-specific 2-thiouridylase [Arenicella sp.]|jgi:tRNA-specific 2-thiouridylase
MARVVIGLSGGVDSSVAAHLLIEQGHEVIGLFMRNWVDDSVIINEECPWVEDSNDAMAVAEKLGIPFQVIDLSQQYKERIVDYMFAEYKNGRTPNPDVLCNREVKFDIFLDSAMQLGADFVATGHYCRKDSFEKDGKTIHRLLAGKDPNKDQSYFLCQLNQAQLAKAMFPIGELLKPQVREIAKELDLITAEKKDSQGLCFIGKVRLPEFLQQQLEPKTGEIVEIENAHQNFHTEFNGSIPQNPSNSDLATLSKPFEMQKSDGKVVGEHHGAHYFTIGQRKGLNVGGTPEPLFIIGTDVNENIVFTGQGKNHKGLLRQGLFVEKADVHWVREDLKLQINEEAKYQVRIRYRQDLEEATLYMRENKLFVIFEKPQKAIAAGQFVAWYEGEELVGSGVIG